MKKKIILGLIILLIIIIILGIAIFEANKNNTSSETNTTENEETVKTIYGFDSDETIDINSNGENTGIYVGQKENYTLISVKIDTELSNEDKILALINNIGNSIGYKIVVNSVTFEDSKITIDFSNEAAPFETSESYVGQGSEIYPIISKNGIAISIFDSIYKTCKFQFGDDTEIYFSVNNENISLSDPQIEIDSNVAYKP